MYVEKAFLWRRKLDAKIKEPRRMLVGYLMCRMVSLKIGP